MNTREANENERWFYRHRAAVGELMRERSTAELSAKDQQRRDAMVDAIWRGLREGIASAPDLFPDIDARRLAERVIDELILGGR